MEALSAYLSRPSDLPSAQLLFSQIPLSELLLLSQAPERNPLVLEALDRAFHDPQTLLFALHQLGVQGVARFCQNSASQTRLLRNIHKIPLQEGLTLGEEFPEILVDCLGNGETAIVEPVTSWLVACGKSNFGSAALQSRKFVDKLNAGLRHRNDTFKLRYCDLLVRLSVSSASLFDTYNTSGLIDFFLSLYDTDDILLKLTLIEVVGLMGDSQLTIQCLRSSPAMRVLAREMEDDRSDEYVRGQLMVLFAKLVEATGDISLLSGRYWQVMNGYLSSQDIGSYNKAITAICHLGQRAEGVAALLGRDTTMRVWLEAARSVVAERRVGLYVSLAHVLSACSGDQSKSLYCRLPGVSSGMSLPCKELLSPFPEFLMPVLSLLQAASRFPWGVSAIFGEPELAEFLLTRNPRQNAEVCVAKFAIVEAASRSEAPLTQLLRTRIAEYIAGGVFAPAYGQVEEAITENIN